MYFNSLKRIHKLLPVCLYMYTYIYIYIFSKIIIIVRQWIVFIYDRLLCSPTLKKIKFLWNYMLFCLNITQLSQLENLALI